MIRKIMIGALLGALLGTYSACAEASSSVGNIAYKSFRIHEVVEQNIPIVDKVSHMLGVYRNSTEMVYDKRTKAAIGYLSEGFLMPIDEGEPAQLMDARHITTVGGAQIAQEAQVVHVEGRTIPKEALLARHEGEMDIHRDEKGHIIGALTTEKYVRWLTHDLASHGEEATYVGAFSGDAQKRYMGTISLHNGEEKVYVYVHRGPILLRVTYLTITNDNGEYGRDFFRTIKKHNEAEDIKRNM